MKATTINSTFKWHLIPTGCALQFILNHSLWSRRGRKTVNMQIWSHTQPPLLCAAIKPLNSWCYYCSSDSTSTSMHSESRQRGFRWNQLQTETCLHHLSKHWYLITYRQMTALITRISIHSEWVKSDKSRLSSHARLDYCWTLQR